MTNQDVGIMAKWSYVDSVILTHSSIPRISYWDLKPSFSHMQHVCIYIILLLQKYFIIIFWFHNLIVVSKRKLSITYYSSLNLTIHYFIEQLGLPNSNLEYALPNEWPSLNPRKYKILFGYTYMCQEKSKQMRLLSKACK